MKVLIQIARVGSCKFFLLKAGLFFLASCYPLFAKAQPHPCEWKFYLAFEDATGAKDTLWLIWHPENTPVEDDPVFGEISLPVSEIDTGQFVLWFDGNFLNSGRRIYAPAYCWAGIAIHAANYQLPITVSWDTTHFQSPSLTSPECVGIGWNTYGAGVTNGILGNEYILDYGYGLPSPPFPWYGVIMFLTSIELVEVPNWPWFTNFPLGFDLKCGDPNETPWSTRNLRSEPELHVYPNPVSDKLHIQTQLRWYSAEVYSVHGTRLLTTSATIERNNVPTYSLPPGMYLLVLYDEYGKVVGRSRFVKI